MSEALDPAPDEFVLRCPHASEERLGRMRLLGSIERIGSDGPLFLLRIKGKANSKEAWQAALRALGDDTVLFPVLFDRDRAPHYPTGEVTVRFDAAPTDADLGRFCDAQRLRLLRRNEFVPQQIVGVPLAAASEFLPDLVARLAAQPGVHSAWANTQSQYRRA
jgi:hypothetical protein